MSLNNSGEITPEPSWETLCRELKGGKAVIILLGNTDTGKSTLAEYLVRRTISEKTPIALVDADVGQSRLGLPGTIGLKIFREPGDMGTDEPNEICFVGTLNPADEIPAMAAGVKQMADKAEAMGVRRIVVDTTGLVSGEAGKALKLAKIKALAPSRIAALQKCGELEHILAELDDSRVTRLSLSPMVAARNRGKRAGYRQARFREYFSRPWLHEIPWHRVQVHRGGMPLVIKDNSIGAGTLVGLNRGEDTRALGIIDECKAGKLRIMTPLASLDAVDRILVSDICVPELW